MNTVTTIDELQKQLKARRKRDTVVGLVPTMGYLHEGHLSLITRARVECDCVVASIFVNPLQFGPEEDYETYPRDPARDAKLASDAGVDVLFIPEKGVMYPKQPLTTVSVSHLTDVLCGASRPTHFDGVTTVVAKLFNLIRPDKAFFGSKDIQQVAVIQQMVEDLNMSVAIIPCPTVREADGLALSSRNVYLDPDEREQATVLNQALREAEIRLKKGQWCTGTDVEAWVKDTIAAQPLADIDYVEMRTFPRLERVKDIDDASYVIAVAVKFGHTRLIDNVLIHGKEA